ncbi:MAG: NADH-quinone oxidoreductase subunit C [Actinobacteria bacterium]|nr:NADH-quinone oxidoreductase subunit C [Actinomycetota bacterium]
MTTSPSDAPPEEATEEAQVESTQAPEESPLSQLATRVAESVGGRAEVNFGTAKVRVDSARWVEALTKARDEHGLAFFSWLSAIDWSNDPSVGDKLTSEVEERYELLAAVSDLSQGHMVIYSTDLPHEMPAIASLTSVYPGANWHERESAEMFGINFQGHPQLEKLYLPDGFQGNPLRKSFPLLSREVKPWPGMVDVEKMPGQGDDEEPSEENPQEEVSTS